MSNLENQKYSFWKLLKEVGIKIPIIQRDYAQGRDNKHVNTIRENFLDNLHEAIKDSKTINLDFVYGTIEDNYLIPLDGQQRLTTLFLLHYYLALKEKRLDDEIKKILLKFTYETRLSSREFCELLISKDLELVDDKDISIIIKDQTWFFSNWENDPTIKAMLTMLDSIQDKFIDDNLFENLTSTKKPPITFSFLNLDDFKLTDELYIKMNARGKPLTEFENFKSKFEKFIKNEKTKAKLDNDWYDIFWNLTDKKDDKSPAKEADEKFFNFFKNITAFYSNDFDEVDVFKFEYNSKISEITKTLDCLIYKKYKSIVKELRDYKDFKIDIFQDFLKDSEKITYEERLRFYALMKFFIKIGKIDNNEKLFKQWMRVSLNIIHNTIYNTTKEFDRDKKILDEMINLLDNEFYKQLSTSTISTTAQFEEEKLKAKLVNDNPDWEQYFLEAEKHSYLDGEIGFLIDLSSNNENDFEKYRCTFEKLWKFTIKDTLFLLNRALLTIKLDDKIDTMGYIKDTKHGDNRYTFCTFGKGLREKNENWRKVFSNQYFKKLMEKLKDLDDIEVALKDIVEAYKFDENDWKSYIINPSNDWTILDNIRNFQIEFNDDTIFLNRGDTRPTSWGWRRISELHSYYLYRLHKETKQEKDTITYKLSTDKKPCLSFKDSNDEEKCIYYKREFCFDIDECSEKKTFEEIKKILEENLK